MPKGSARVANREVELMLERGETIDWRAPVMARHWWHYFRVTHGVLVATNRRLCTSACRRRMSCPREPEPQLLEESSFPYDRPIDHLARSCVPRNLNGVVIRAPGQMRTFGVASSERVRLDSVLALMRRHQKEIREPRRGRATEGPCDGPGGAPTGPITSSSAARRSS
jgi:hypothetical protein